MHITIDTVLHVVPLHFVRGTASQEASNGLLITSASGKHPCCIAWKLGRASIVETTAQNICKQTTQHGPTSGTEVAKDGTLAKT